MKRRGAQRLAAAAWALVAVAATAQPPAAHVDALQLDGEAALRAGHPRQALEAFERAASLRHSAPIEIGIVRALMQNGDYRRALAFAGHTAFAHPESQDAASLYALLLRLGGHTPVAQRLIDAALQRAPDDVALKRARDVLSLPQIDPQVQALTAIVPTGDAIPAHASVIGHATLLPDGQHALAPLPTGATAGPLWLRNGLGRTVRAQLRRADAASGLAVLALDDPLPAPGTTAGTRRPFPGSPAFVVAFASNRQPAWPQLSSGFLGATPASGDGQWLGVEVAVDCAGAPVFDGAGRLIGMVAPAASDARLRFVSLAGASTLAPLLQPAGGAAGGVLGVDEIYERGLRTALQVIAAR